MTSWRDGDTDDRRIGPAAPATARPVRPAIGATLAWDRPPPNWIHAARPSIGVVGAALAGHAQQGPPLARLPVLSEAQTAAESARLSAVHRPLQWGATLCRILSDCPDRRARRRAVSDRWGGDDCGPPGAAVNPLAATHPTGADSARRAHPTPRQTANQRSVVRFMPPTTPGLRHSRTAGGSSRPLGGTPAVFRRTALPAASTRSPPPSGRSLSPDRAATGARGFGACSLAGAVAWNRGLDGRGGRAAP